MHKIAKIQHNIAQYSIVRKWRITYPLCMVSSWPLQSQHLCLSKAKLPLHLPSTLCVRERCWSWLSTALSVQECYHDPSQNWLLCGCCEIGSLCTAWFGVAIDALCNHHMPQPSCPDRPLNHFAVSNLKYGDPHPLTNCWGFPSDQIEHDRTIPCDALAAAGQLVGPFVAQFSMQNVGLLMFVDTLYRYMMIYDDIYIYCFHVWGYDNSILDAHAQISE
jgi:hypothetical protein